MENHKLLEKPIGWSWNSLNIFMDDISYLSIIDPNNRNCTRHLCGQDINLGTLVNTACIF